MPQDIVEMIEQSAAINEAYQMGMVRKRGSGQGNQARKRNKRHPD